MTKTPVLTWKILYQAYRKGCFPMDESGEIYWYCPDPRSILEFKDFHIPGTLKSILKKNQFEIRFDFAFKEVIKGCQDRERTWISEEIIQAYIDLHQQGMAHSVEAWQDGILAGGLYGVSIGGAFMGESMFHRISEASKVCLVFLVERLKERGYEILDIQFMTQNLQRFGAIEIPKKEYLSRLKKALQKKCTFQD
ncbi:MAG: leucyl/phenylalanyl-tRNA--protein transferase [Planctomycetota bacterium]